MDSIGLNHALGAGYGDEYRGEMKSSRVTVASVALTFRLICLFLLIATAAAWIDSFWHGTYARWDSWSLTPIGWRHTIREGRSGRGGIAIVSGVEEGTAAPALFNRSDWDRSTKPGYASWNTSWDPRRNKAFSWISEAMEHHAGYIRGIIFPHYGLAVLLAITPLTWLVGKVMKRRIHRPGFCRRCGYNLTGNVSNICPECGTPTQQDIETVSVAKSPMMNV